MTHLNSIIIRLENEKTRLSMAKKEQEILSRTHIVKMVEKELESELKFLGMAELPNEINEMSADELLAALGM